MHHIQLNDQVYTEAERRAVNSGFTSVDDYVVDLLTNDMFEFDENIDHLFTPERIAHIDRAAAQIATGKSHTASQVHEHFKKRFEV